MSVMRAVFGVLLLIAVVAYATEAPSSPLVKGVYDYHRRFGIPQAQKIKQFEHGIVSRQRVAGGSITTPLSVPYQAGLLMTVLLFSSVCGGALISDTTVLTAAHCYNDGSIIPTSITVVLGSNFLFSGGTRITDVTVTPHSEYNPEIFANDIAVVRFPRVTFSITLQAIDIPLFTNELASNFAGVSAIASGYGITNDGDSIGLLQSLSSVSLRVMTNEECSSIYPNIIRNTHMCTSGANGVGICDGDTGGPLVVFMNLRRVLIGIGSFLSAQGCQAGFPSGFTRITSYMGWINSV